MKSDETGKAPTSSTTPTKKGSGLTGLLGGAINTKDPLALVGIGVGATQRAKDLILKGLEFERQEELKAFMKDEIAKLAAEEVALNEELKRLDKLLGSKSGTKGRPTKGCLTIDIERAAAVIDAADLYFERFNRKISSQEKAIDIAIQIDAILVKHGDRNKRLFWVTMPAIRNSVSKGLN